MRPHLYVGALNARNRLAASLRRPPSTPRDSVPLADSVPGAQCFRPSPQLSRSRTGGIPSITADLASTRQPQCPMPPLTHLRNLRIGQPIGDASNHTFGAVAFTRIPAQESAEEAHTMRMGYRGDAAPLMKSLGPSPLRGNHPATMLKHVEPR